MLVIDCLNRLASNAIFKALENIRRRDIYPIGLAGAFRVRVRVRVRARRNPNAKHEQSFNPQPTARKSLLCTHVMLSRKDIPSRLPRFDDEHDVCNSMPDRPLRCIAWFWLFAVLVLSPPRRTVLVIDCLNRLASNAIFKALENIRRRDICPIGLGAAFRARAPFH